MLTLVPVLAYESDEIQHPSSDPFEPTNYNEFRRMSDKVKRHEVERTGQLSPTTERLLKGCKQLILAGDLIAQNAHDNSPIIAERRKRQAMANRVIQTGGVITIQDAKGMKRAREGVEAEKEEKAEKRCQAKRNKLIAADNKKRKQQAYQPFLITSIRFSTRTISTGKHSSNPAITRSGIGPMLIELRIHQKLVLRVVGISRMRLKTTGMRWDSVLGTRKTIRSCKKPIVDNYIVTVAQSSCIL
ncbi:hypothetical protein QFC19_004105 [Naganishia cerealis]|uniref:Uncharacterized protein n=1 Tax=Naganishia cerealis TaxID=610337 RepID=A0ACC2VYB3_9TREE|nr:hypothetical protein QFC19_004105 [Naganishia cerealis]